MGEYCQFCGSELPPTAKFCPNCGNQIQFEDKKNDEILARYPDATTYDDRKYSLLAILSLITTILLFLINQGGLVCSILCLVLSLLGISDTREKKKKGRWCAVLGLVISILYLVLVVILLAAFTSLFV